MLFGEDISVQNPIGLNADACMYVCVCMHVCMCVYVCMCAYMYVCVYVWYLATHFPGDDGVAKWGEEENAHQSLGGG